jgi:hypothetical protein
MKYKLLEKNVIIIVILYENIDMAFHFEMNVLKWLKCNCWLQNTASKRSYTVQLMLACFKMVRVLDYIETPCKNVSCFCHHVLVV